MPRILRQDAERLLANVPEEYTFKCRDGRILKNMQELAEALAVMSDDTFTFHSNVDKSDFSNWVKDIIKDTKLARDLMKSLDQARASQAVQERITFLTSKLV